MIMTFASFYDNNGEMLVKKAPEQLNKILSNLKLKSYCTSSLIPCWGLEESYNDLDFQNKSEIAVSDNGSIVSGLSESETKNQTKKKSGETKPVFIAY